MILYHESTDLDFDGVFKQRVSKIRMEDENAEVPRVRVSAIEAQKEIPELVRLKEKVLSNHELEVERDDKPTKETVKNKKTYMNPIVATIMIMGVIVISVFVLVAGTQMIERVSKTAPFKSGGVIQKLEQDNNIGEKT